MAMNTKLQIEKLGYLDLFEDINIPITKTLADIRDLSKRSGGYSTTIEIPGSKGNLELLGHLYDINISNSTFDLTRKYTCIVIKNDTEIFHGYIRLESINEYEGADGKAIITFNISLHDDIANFFMKIKDKYVNPDDNSDKKNNIFWDDLGFPKYNYENIQEGFLNTVEDGWRFFLPMQTRGWYETLDFKPAVYVYEYMDRIITSAGYNWNGSKNVLEILNTTATGGAYFFTGATNGISSPAFVNADIRPNDTIYVTNTTYNDGTYNILSATTATGGTVVYVSNSVHDGIELTPTFVVKGERLVDEGNWKLLNDVTNFDKLLIPYAGPIDVFKSTSLYETTAGYDNLKYTGFTNGVIIYQTGTTYNQIGLGVAGFTDYLAAGDIIEFSSSTYGIKYLEVQSEFVVTGTNRDYNVTITDVNGIVDANQQSIASNIYVGNIKIYYGRKFLASYETCIGTSDGCNNTVKNYYKLSFNNINGNYSDAYGLLHQQSYGDRIAYTGQYFSGSTGSTSMLTYYTSSVTAISGALNTTIYSANTSGEVQISLNLPYTVIVNANADSSLQIYKYRVGTSGGNHPQGGGGGGFINGSFNLSFNLLVYKNDILDVNYSRYGNYIIQKKAGEIFSVTKGTNTVFTSTFREVLNVPVYASDVLRFEIEFLGNMNHCHFVTTGGTVADVNFHYMPTVDQNIKITTKGPYREDDTLVKVRDFIPKKVKQSDLMLGLCRLFNLFIDYNESTKTLLVLPRDQYYSLGSEIDWSQKLDVSNKNSYMFYPDLTYKTYVYSYKADSDTYSKIYTDNIKNTYGQIELTFDNDFLNGTTTIDSIFYSTPLVRTGGAKNIYDGDVNNPTSPTGTLKIVADNGNIVPAIDYSQTTNLKMLYDCGNITEGSSKPFLFRIKTTEALSTAFTYTFTQVMPADTTNNTPQFNIGWTKYDYKDNLNFSFYPHAGHFYPAPLQPKDDLNYGLNDYYFYPDIVVNTENNLFYKHYLTTIKQQNSGKLLKAKIHLTANEVGNLKFYNSFYVFDSWWHLNSIKFDANSSDLYDIELLSI